jgi:hypothetical protein
VAEDGKKYMKMTKDWGSKTFMAAKSSAPPEMARALKQFVKNSIDEAKDSNPGLAERMSKSDTDKKGDKKDDKRGGKKGGKKGGNKK